MRSPLLIVFPLLALVFAGGSDEARAQQIDFSQFPDDTPLSAVTIPGVRFTPASAGQTWTVLTTPAGKGLHLESFEGKLLVNLGWPQKSITVVTASQRGQSGVAVMYSGMGVDFGFRYGKGTSTVTCARGPAWPGFVYTDYCTVKNVLTEDQVLVPISPVSFANGGSPGINRFELDGIGYDGLKPGLTSITLDPCEPAALADLEPFPATVPQGRVLKLKWQPRRVDDYMHVVRLAGALGTWRIPGPAREVTLRIPIHPVGFGFSGSLVVAGHQCSTPYAEWDGKTVLKMPATHDAFRAGAGVSSSESISATRVQGDVQPIPVDLRFTGGAGIWRFSSSQGLAVTPANLPATTAAAAVVVTPSAALVNQPGLVGGWIRATHSDGASRRWPVLLTVVPPGLPPGGTPGTLRTSSSRVLFSAPRGIAPPSQKVRVFVDAGNERTWVSAAVEPDGAWLQLSSTGFASGFAAEGTDLQLTVDPSAGASDGQIAPLRTVIRLRPVGGTAADERLVEVFYVESSEGVSAPARPPVPPDTRSFVIPAIARVDGAFGSSYLSDGWIRNDNGGDVSADLYFTPAGQDGLGDSVRKTTITIPSGTTVRLFDLLGTWFTSMGAGSLEIRATPGDGVVVGSRLESVSASDPSARFGAEMPVYRNGDGAAPGEALVIANIRDDSVERTNLLVAETSGAPAFVAISVFSADGTEVGALHDFAIPPYAERQIPRIVDAVAPGMVLSRGWVRVTVTGGTGRVVALASLIDNASQSQAIVRAAEPRTMAGRFPRWAVPTAARVTGHNNSLFFTDLNVANPLPSPLDVRITYHYNDLTTGLAGSVRKDLVIPPLGCLPEDLGFDVVRNLFGVQNPSVGWILIETGLDDTFAAAGSIRTAVDPNDPSRGYRIAFVDGARLTRVYDTELDVTTPSDRLLDEMGGLALGGERSVVRRTNLILVNPEEKSVGVVVDLVSKAGGLIGSRTYTLAPWQYLQVNDIFGTPSGIGLQSGAFDDVAVIVRSLNSFKVLALISVNDNLSRSPEVYYLRRLEE